MEERTSDIKDRNLEMMQREEERDLSIKKMKEFCDNYLTPSKRAMQEYQAYQKKRGRRKQPFQTNS